MDGWKTTFLLRVPIFRCYVSFREGIQAFNENIYFHGVILQSVTLLMPSGLDQSCVKMCDLLGDVKNA